MLFGIVIPADGQIGVIKLAPDNTSFTFSRRDLTNLFKFSDEKTINVKHESMLTDPVNIVKFDGNSIGNKVRDMSDFGDILVFIMWIFVFLGSDSLMQIIVTLSTLFHVVKKFRYFNTSYGPYMKFLLMVLDKGKVTELKDYQMESFWYNYKNSKMNTLLSPGPYQPYSFWIIRSKLMRLLFVMILVWLRKKFIYASFKKWEAQYGKDYLMDPEDRMDIDEFYEDLNLPNPKKDIPLMNFGRRLLLKIYNISFCLEIGLFCTVV